MKNYRLIVPIALVVFLILSWFTLISGAVNKNSQYEDLLATARDFAGKKIAKYAVENYRKALEIEDSPAIRQEVADLYKSLELHEERLIWCEQFITDFPTSPEAYDSLLDAYIIDEKYERVFDILEVAEKRSVDSEFIRETRNRLAYLTKLTYDTYEDVGVFSQNRCPVMNDKGLWGYLSHTGRKLSRFEYSAAGPFTSSGFAPVVSKEGEAFFIDKDNDQVTEIDERFARLGPIVSDVFPAEAKDGKYYLVNRNNEILSEPYDFVSSVNSGVAIAKSGTQWVRIDTSGVPISGQAYSDVVLDDRGFFNRNERYFAKEGDGVVSAFPYPRAVRVCEGSFSVLSSPIRGIRCARIARSILSFSDDRRT
jgi:tetratricopeptide (TPR) repeat protein